MAIASSSSSSSSSLSVLSSISSLLLSNIVLLQFLLQLQHDLPLSNSFQIPIPIPIPPSLLVTTHSMTFSKTSMPDLKKPRVGPASSFHLHANSNDNNDNATNATNNVLQRLAIEMDDRASSNSHFTDVELDELKTSFYNICKNIHSTADTTSNTDDADTDDADADTADADDTDDDTDDTDEMWNKLHELYVKVGHLSHKDWQRTGESSAVLTNILLGSSSSSSRENNDNDNATNDNDNTTANTNTNINTHGLTEKFQHMFHRVLKEGNWDQALDHSMSNSHSNNDNNSDDNNNKNNSKPWAVLVTGVNGIRKTTSVYQSWFPQLLKQALIAPDDANTNANANTDTDTDTDIDTDTDTSSKSSTFTLPTGHNSFFRQLDHMIASISNNNFQQLYELTSQSHDFKSSSTTTSTSTQPSKEVIQTYSNYKASIFKRYRTLSEILGITLIQQAMKSNLNVMIETSGRDVAMYHYIDMFFPNDTYNKLVLHFEINDLEHAERSVDGRMVKEMEDGVKVLLNGIRDTADTADTDTDTNNNSGHVNVRDLINVNAGGPYGSEVLKGIQTDSNNVWNTIIQDKKDDNNNNENTTSVGHDWYKASIKIDASATEDWTARAVLPNGEDGEVFTFEAPRKV